MPLHSCMIFDKCDENKNEKFRGAFQLDQSPMWTWQLQNHYCALDIWAFQAQMLKYDSNNFFLIYIYLSGSMYFDVLESGKHGKYKLYIVTFISHTQKWPSICERMTQVAAPTSNINPVQDKEWSVQFKEKILFTYLFSRSSWCSPKIKAHKGIRRTKNFPSITMVVVLYLLVSPVRTAFYIETV
jgi:hypothetical protein